MLNIDVMLSYVAGMAMGPLAAGHPMTTFVIDCLGYEDNINTCIIKNEGYCSSRNYVSLYCSTSNIENKGERHKYRKHHHTSMPTHVAYTNTWDKFNKTRY